MRMATRQAFAGLALLGAGLILLAGCGGGHDAATSADKRAEAPATSGAGAPGGEGGAPAGRKAAGDGGGAQGGSGSANGAKASGSSKGGRSGRPRSGGAGSGDEQASSGGSKAIDELTARIERQLKQEAREPGSALGKLTEEIQAQLEKRAGSSGQDGVPKALREALGGLSPDG